MNQPALWLQITAMLAIVTLAALFTYGIGATIVAWLRYKHPDTLDWLLSPFTPVTRVPAPRQAHRQTPGDAWIAQALRTPPELTRQDVNAMSMGMATDAHPYVLALDRSEVEKLQYYAEHNGREFRSAQLTRILNAMPQVKQA